MIGSPSIYAKRMIAVIMITALLMMIAGIVLSFYFEAITPISFALGVAAAASLNTLKVLWLKKTVETAVSLNSELAGSYVRIQHSMRFLFTGVVLVAIVFIPFIDIVGALCGIMTMPVAAHTMQFFHRRDTIKAAANQDTAENPANIPVKED